MPGIAGAKLPIGWPDGYQSPDFHRITRRYWIDITNHTSDHSLTYIHNSYAEQTREAYDLVLQRASPKLLEVGCGAETLWFGLAGASALGVDIQEPRLAVARERLSYIQHNYLFDLDVRFENSSFFNIAEHGSFDLIWMEQAFHHIEPRAKVGEKLNELLKPGGYAVISETNAWNPLIQIELFRKRGFRTARKYTDQYGIVHEYGDERITTAGKLGRMLRKHGFAIEAIKYFRSLPNLSNVEKFSWLESLIPGWAAPAHIHFNLVARKNRRAVIYTQPMKCETPE